MELDLEQIKEILDAFEERNMQKFELKKGDFEIVLERMPNTNETNSMPSYLPQMIAASQLSPNLQGNAQQQGTLIETQPAQPVEEGTFITSPMVGTFYAAPSPEEPTFVKVGDRVEKGQVVCIIEAMKVMNEVKSSETGVLKEILLESGHPLEFGSKIFRIG